MVRMVGRVGWWESRVLVSDGAGRAGGNVGGYGVGENMLGGY